MPKTLEQVMEEMPRLTYYGFETWSFWDRRPKGVSVATWEQHLVEEFEQDRARLRRAQNEFDAACHWLATKTKTKRARRDGYGDSYCLKHDVEDAVGRYVSNGAFIAAAHAMGFPVEPMGPSSGPSGGIRAYIGVGKRDLRGENAQAA